MSFFQGMVLGCEKYPGDLIACVRRQWLMKMTVHPEFEFRRLASQDWFVPIMGLTWRYTKPIYSTQEGRPVHEVMDSKETLIWEAGRGGDGKPHTRFGWRRTVHV